MGITLRENYSYNTGCPDWRYTEIHAYVLVPKSFMNFMFPIVYRVTQNVYGRA
jgi:hypothetical protein